MKSYCIREDYVPRTEAVTYVDDPSEYWTRGRIRASGYYQYYVYKRAAELLSASPGASFADVGCGYPRKVEELILPLTRDVTLIDQPSMKDFLERRFPAMRFVPMNLEEENEAFSRRFDVVLAADVIEHLLDPDRLLAFLRRIVKPSGVMILSTPEREIQWGRDCLSSPQPEHVREWSSTELVAYLEHSGLEVLEHCLLPKGRLSRIEELFRPITRHLRISRYAGCQVAICRPEAGIRPDPSGIPLQ